MVATTSCSRGMCSSVCQARITSTGSVVGAVLGLALAIGLFAFSDDKARPIRLRPLVMAPFAMGGAGFFLSLAITCLFAPSSFLIGPHGRPYLEKIGSRSVTTARVVCLLVALLIGCPLVGMTFLFIMAARS